MMRINWTKPRSAGMVIFDSRTTVRNIQGDPIKYMESVSGENVQIGDHTIIEAPVTIGNNVTIGDYCKIKANTNIVDNTTVGDGSIIG